MGFHIKLFQQNTPKCLSGATSIFFITPESGLILSECFGALTPAGQLTGHSVISRVRSSRETAPHNRCEAGTGRTVDSAANALTAAAVKGNLSDKEWQAGNKSKMHLAPQRRALFATYAQG